MRRPIAAAAIVATLLSALLAPAAFACAPEGGPWPLSQMIAQAIIAVEGTVTAVTDSEPGADDWGTVVEISVERVLKGSPGATTSVRDESGCPFRPSAGDRVVVAANAEGGLILAWFLDGPAAQQWISTDPELTTTAAIHAAFDLPDTALDSPARASSGRGAALPLLVVAWAVSALGSLALLSRRRRGA